MSKSTIKELPKSSVEIEILIPWSEIAETYDKVLSSVTKQAEISGFRKGKAPKDLVEKKADKAKIYEEVLKEIIPKAYSEAIREHNLRPIISPQIEVLKAKTDEDWTVKAIISQKPKVNLNNYKEKIREAKKGKVKIWTPGTKDEKNEPPKLSFEDIVSIIVEEVEVDISDQLITQEANRLLSDLIDQTKQVGLTVEQYLMSKGKTTEQLRSEYAQTAKKNLALEFALAEIAENEKITVEQADIDKILTGIKDDKEKDRLQKESYYLAHLIRQQKTLDFLGNL